MIKCQCPCGAASAIDTGSLSVDKELWADWMLAHQPCTDALVLLQAVMTKRAGAVQTTGPQWPSGFQFVDRAAPTYCEDCGGTGGEHDVTCRHYQQ